MYIYQHECGLVASEWQLERYGWTELGFSESKFDAYVILAEKYEFFDDWDVQDFLNDNWIW